MLFSGLHQNSLDSVCIIKLINKVVQPTKSLFPVFKLCFTRSTCTKKITKNIPVNIIWHIKDWIFCHKSRFPQITIHYWNVSVKFIALIKKEKKKLHKFKISKKIYISFKILKVTFSENSFLCDIYFILFESLYSNNLLW